MPKEVRDPYSNAKIFIPTPQEKSIKQMEVELKEKLEEVNEIITRLKAVE